MNVPPSPAARGPAALYEEDPREQDEVRVVRVAGALEQHQHAPRHDEPGQGCDELN